MAAKKLVYLGRVHEVLSTRDGYRFAHVEPVLESSDDLRTWRGRVHDLLFAFPDRGKVFWHDAPEWLRRDSYWQFRVTESPSYNGADKPEKYQIEDPTHPTEVIDLRGRGGERAVRRLLTTDGIALKSPPLSPKVLLWMEDDRWVGPVALVHGSRGWKIGPNENLSRLECWCPPAAAAFKMEDAGPRWLLNPIGDFGKHAGFCNWMGDVDFAKGLLRRLRKLDRQVHDGLGVTMAVFDGYLTAMEAAGLVGADLEQELGRKERIAEVSGLMRRNKQLLDEAVTTLLGLPVIQEELAARKAAEYERMRQELQVAVERELAASRQTLRQLEEEIAREMTRLREVEAKIESKEAELERRVASFEDEFKERLRRARDQPQEIFADLALLRAVLSDSATVPTTDRTQSTRTLEVDPPRPVGRTLNDESALLRTLTATCRAHGVSPMLGMELHVAFLSGSVPLLTGGAAFDALRAYADTVTSGRILWIPVSASSFEPQDLLGRLDVPTRRIVPHPGGLLDVILEASRSDDLYVVVLEGLNRAPVDSYLLPLLESRSDTWLSRSPRTIPLAAERAVDPSDPYWHVLRVAWPPNVLLAALPVFGGSALPLPESIWRYAVLVDCSGSSEPSSPGGIADPHSSQEPSWVSHSLWLKWRRPERGRCPESIARILRGLGLDPALEHAVESIYAAARSCGLGDDAALRLAAKLSLLPALDDDRVEILTELLESEGVQLGPDRNAVRQLVRKLMD